MNQVTAGNFGLLVAYVLPGFVALLGVSQYSTTVRTWLTAPGPSGPTVGGFLYLTLASLTAGLIVSTIRWALVDFFHHVTGLRAPAWRFSGLQEALPAFELLVESHYRYYQFYANMLVAAAVAYAAWRASTGASPQLVDAVFVALECVLALGSRDTLSKYYRRAEEVLSRGPAA